MNGLETDPVEEVESFQKYSKMEENSIFMKQEWSSTHKEPKPVAALERDEGNPKMKEGFKD